MNDLNYYLTQSTANMDEAEKQNFLEKVADQLLGETHDTHDVMELQTTKRFSDLTAEENSLERAAFVKFGIKYPEYEGLSEEELYRLGVLN